LRLATARQRVVNPGHLGEAGQRRETAVTRQGQNCSRKIFVYFPLTYIARQCMNIKELVMLSKELVAASAEPLILSLLSGGESYGYAIIQEVKARSKDRIQWTDGMLYPVLHRMESEGWITSRWMQAENGRKRKYYAIKQDGKQALEQQREQWLTVHSVLAGLWKERYV
jgi:DNA-binding PadR family transcriptional regulator